MSMEITKVRGRGRIYTRVVMLSGRQVGGSSLGRKGRCCVSATSKKEDFWVQFFLSYIMCHDDNEWEGGGRK